MRLMKSASVLTLFSAVLIVVVGCDNSETNSTPSGSGAATTTPQVAEQPKPATQPIIPIAQMKDWCPEHGMPESICVQCNASLAAEFKAKGDWDEKHNLPKSQCFECDPSLKEKFAAGYKQNHGEEPPAPAAE